MNVAKKCLFLISGICDHPRPSIVDINLTTRCNQKCIYCEIGQGFLKSKSSVDNFLNLNDIKWIIDEMRHEKIQDLVLLGGEPFLFKDLFQAIEYASEHIQNISIITNGMRIPKLSSRELMILKRCKCTMIISLDSFRSETNNMIRGVPNAFENAVMAIKILVHNSIPVQIETVISQYNYQDLANVVRNAYGLGASSVNLIPLITSSNFPTVEGIPQKQDLNPGPEDIKRLFLELDEIIAFQEKNAIQTNASEMKRWLEPYITYHTTARKKDDCFFKYRLNRFFCWTVYSRIKINAYGEVQPCNLISSDISIRDRPEESLLQKWNKACQPVRTLLKDEAYPLQCTGCYSSHSANILLSTLKYPLENRGNLPRVFIDYVHKMTRK